MTPSPARSMASMDASSRRAPEPSDDDIDACFETAIDDAGTIDLETLLRSEGRKDSELERS